MGPGLLFAGAAVGVSHLVQSTKAGAAYGFGLLLAVLLANIMKYPFFEFGTRYSMSTGETLIDGYAKQGKWALIVFILVTIATMFTIQAAVTVVTAALAINLFNGILFDLSIWQWSTVILVICSGILLVGRFSVLDKLMKVVIITLTITTIIAVLALLFFGQVTTSPEFQTSFNWTQKDVIFLIALMGWMPAPLDLSVWSSIWSLEKKQINPESNLKTALFDFNVGYIGTVFLAICFVTLGALTMYGTGEELSPKGGVFAGQLISIYTKSLGDWAKPIIAIAAFTTMFSTTLTCLDAFPRVLGRTTIVLLPQYEGKHSRKLYWFWIGIIITGALVVLGFLITQMGVMINIATILSFLVAPFLAILNYLLVTGKLMPEADKPPKWMIVLSWIGMIFLVGFSILYLIYMFV